MATILSQPQCVNTWEVKSFCDRNSCSQKSLTHWGRVTHICVSKLTIIGSDNGLSPGRHQTIIWTNAGILLIGSLGTNFSEILIAILTFSFKCIWKCCLQNGGHFVSASMCWWNIKSQQWEQLEMDDLVLNSLWETNKIFAFSHFSTLQWCRELKFFLMQAKDLFTWIVITHGACLMQIAIGWFQ